jgi:hypothetical protein
VPGLRRSHEHHRNLHARLDAAIPTAAAANCDQDRYVVITSPCYRFKIPIVLAGRRSATAALVQICFCDLNMAIDLRGLRQIPAPAADQSCAAKSSTNALMAGACRHAAPPPTNPHNERHRRLPLPAVSFIEGFRTPPPVQAASSQSAGIRNPQHSRPGGTSGRSSHVRFAPIATEVVSR